MAALAAVVAVLGGCAAADDAADEHEWAAESLLYPRITATEPAGAFIFEFGPGGLTTTDDERWAGTRAITYPPIFEPGEAITIEVRGLDLSGIRYTGDMGWPPDETDRGALVSLALAGTPGPEYRIYSSLQGRDVLWDGRRIGPDSYAGYRSYVFQGRDADGKSRGGPRFSAEAWGGRERPEFDTVDLRLRYVHPSVSAWARLSASWSWEDGNRLAGAPCPWNPAINTAVEGTADSVWTGACVPGPAGATGRAWGAWMPSPGGGWRVGADPGTLQPRIAIFNWENAAGPYRVRWKNFVVTGVPARTVPMALGAGRVVPFGSARERALLPAGDPARFSFLAVARAAGLRGGAQLHYRAANIDLVSTGSDWVAIEAARVSFAGTATLNGQDGFGYELQATDGGHPSGSDGLSIRVWRTGGSFETPAYLAAGALQEGDIRISRAR